MSERNDTAACRSCRKEIIWTVTESGKKMPVDLRPCTYGKFFIFRRADSIDSLSVRSKNRDAEEARKRNQDRYDSHFATCAHADRHRRAR
jgi:hypothetical protein